MSAQRQSSAKRLTDTDWPTIPQVAIDGIHSTNVLQFSLDLKEWHQLTQELWNRRVLDLEKRIADLESGS